MPAIEAQSMSGLFDDVFEEEEKEDTQSQSQETEKVVIQVEIRD
jgi:lactate dehydrogenase-like 2-hydroxyacid dehydrogenase